MLVFYGQFRLQRWSIKLLVSDLYASQSKQ